MMAVSTTNQAWVFLAMCAVGGGLGILFDLFRLLRKALRPGTGLTGVTDIVFWILVSLGLFGALFYINSGQIRWFEPAGVLIGAGIYFLSLSSIISYVMEKVARIIFKIFTFLLKIVLTPLLFLYKMILFLFRPIVGLIKWTVKTIKRMTGGMAKAWHSSWRKFLLATKKT